MMDRTKARHIIDEMKSFLRGLCINELHKVGPAFIESFSELLLEDIDDRQRILLSVQLLEAVWEQLNVGSWRKTPLEFRKLYSYASLTLAAGHLHNGDENKAVQALDKGLILGAPVGDTDVENRLRHFAALIHGQHKIPRDLEQLCNDRGQEIDYASLASLGSAYSAVDELTLPSINEIVRRIAASCPLKIYSLMDSWPALKNWNVRLFLQTMGKRTVPVEIGSRYTDDEWGQRLMTVETFIRDHLRSNGYIAQYGLLDQVPELKDDIIIPDYCYALNDDEPEVNFWFGGRTVSPLHYDDRQNVLCQVFGTKVIVLFAPDQTENLYQFDSPLLHNTSQVDIENCDHLKFPKFSHARGMRVLLGPGEALLIPKGWWHFVKSLSYSSCSLSFWFG